MQQCLLDEIKEEMKKKNTKQVESLFKAHLGSSHDVELFAAYLNHVQMSRDSRDTVNDAINYAFTKTMLHVSSTDLKIRYLESLMSAEEKEKVQKAYHKALGVPLQKAETLVELYRNYEQTKTKTHHKKQSNETHTRESAAVAESKELAKVLGNQKLGIDNVSAFIEHTLRCHNNRHPLYTDDYVAYAIDAAIEIRSDASPEYFVYKLLHCINPHTHIQGEHISNKHTKGMALSSSRSDKILSTCRFLSDALSVTNNSCVLLAALTTYKFNPEEILQMAPDSITQESESFYTAFFSALLRHKNLVGVRTYLLQLVKEGKLGYKSLSLCAGIEAVVGKEARNAAGILISSLKQFLGVVPGSFNTPLGSGRAITPSENAFGILVEGVRILLELGDIQKARLLLDTYYNANPEKPVLAHEFRTEGAPKMILAKHELLYDSGFLGVLPLFGDFTYQDIYRFLTRCYDSEPVEVNIETPKAFTEFLRQLPSIRDSQNLCGNVNLNEVIQILSSLQI